MALRIPKVIEKVAEEIRTRKIHGSTLAAIRAIEALLTALKELKVEGTDELIEAVKLYSRALFKARPTNIMLINFLRHIIRTAEQFRNTDPDELKLTLKHEISRLHIKVEESLERIKLIGSRRIPEKAVILTHSMSNTVYSIISRAVDEGKDVSVIVTESRPDFEGRLMASKLLRLNIPVTLTIDSAVRYFIKDIDLVLLGAEAVAANGAVVNKVGTSLVALAAYEARVRVYVAAGTYKFSPETMIGMPIRIEYRDPEVVLPEHERKAYGLEGIDIRTPIYDVTPPDYIDLLITERGVFPPQAAIIILRESYGWPQIGIEMAFEDL